MDVNIGRCNDKMNDFMPYQSHIRHGDAKHFYDRFHPITHSPSLPKPYYFNTVNKWNAMMNGNFFNPYMYGEPFFPRPTKQRFINQSENENNALKTCNNVENIAPTNLTEKTPMCLVNEIVRFNKIDQKYFLVNEEGPAHKKTFFVTLKLGDETFSSSGQSIKKARHSAALEALKNTKHKKPPSKSAHPSADFNSSMTPTVELNTIATRKGETASYEVVGGFKSTKPTISEEVLDYYSSWGHNPAFVVKLSMGGHDYYGDGYSVKSARHSAATKAIYNLKEVKPNDNLDNDPIKEIRRETSLTPAVGLSSRKGNKRGFGVSRVHEIALKRKLITTFNVTSESGPAHMRMYVTTCECGTFKTTGEGHSKKISKQEAAEKMLEELERLSPLQTPTVVASKPKNRFKKKFEHSNAIDRTFHKVLKANPDYGAGINPISRLIQIQQAKKLAEPSFLLVEERGNSRDKEFNVQVTVGDKTCSSWASNKRLAKRNAAESMLHLLGYSKSSNQSDQTLPKKVTFSDANDIAKEIEVLKMGVKDIQNDDNKGGDQLTPKYSMLSSYQPI